MDRAHIICFSVAKFGTAKPCGFFGTLPLCTRVFNKSSFFFLLGFASILLRFTSANGETKRVFAEPSLAAALSLYHLLAS